MKENYEKIILYGLLGLTFLGLIFAFTGFPTVTSSAVSPNSKEKASADSSSFRSIDSGTTDSGDVSVELTPHKVDNGQLVVDIAVNTHSVDLNPFDLKKITTLEYNGKIVNPVSAPSLGGHHSNGKLVFKVEEDINTFTIKIRGIPKVEERVFSW